MAKRLLVLLALAWAKITVYGPETLRNKVHTKYSSYEVPSSLANFGNPPYGSVIVGRVFNPMLPSEVMGCGPLSAIDFSVGDPDLIITPILLLDRGNCSFVQKVRHAQDIGASAVVIADSSNEDPRGVLMSDDGTGGNLNIPTFLIKKDDAALFRTTMEEIAYRGVVSLTLSFEMQHGLTNVTYDVWMSSDQELVRSFLNDFSQYARKLDKVTVFTPHYVLWYCSECRKGGYKKDNLDCVSSGRYCAPDPDGVGPLTGKHVVLEDLRQICVYQKAKAKWWDYIEVMNATCPTEKFNSDCAVSALGSAKIDKDEIQACMDDSFETPTNTSTDNSLLRKERDELIKAGIFFFPAVIVNSQTMRGDVEAIEVVQAVCAGFQERPRECFEILGGLHPNTPPEQEGISMGILLAIVCGAVVLLAGVLVVYRMWLKREINSELKKQINLAVGQYFALADTSREEA